MLSQEMLSNCVQKLSPNMVARLYVVNQISIHYNHYNHTIQVLPCQIEMNQELLGSGLIRVIKRYLKSTQVESSCVYVQVCAFSPSLITRTDTSLSLKLFNYSHSESCSYVFRDS